MKPFAAVVAVACLLAGLAATGRVASAASCDSRAVVESFVEVLNAGDAVAADARFAASGAGWRWYSVGDRAGRRLGDAASRRGTLGRYLAARVSQHERLRLLGFTDGGNGNFGMLLRRQADDLHRGEAVQRMGKGWVVCATGTIGVWSVGGAPPPEWWGQCPTGAFAISAADLDAAGRAVVRFVRDVYSEMSPGTDTQGVRVIGATLAPGFAKGYAARVKCGRVVQARTAVVTVRFPRVAARARMSSAAFYASRLGDSWRVWRLVG